MQPAEILRLRKVTGTTQYAAARGLLCNHLIVTDALENIIVEIKKKHDQIAEVANPERPWSEENRTRVRGLAILGNSGSGKTLAAETAIDLIKPVAVAPGVIRQPKIVSIATPDGGTASALALELIVSNGLPITREPLAKEAVGKVLRRVVANKPTLVFIDEVSRCALPIHNPSVIRRETGLVWSMAMGMLDAKGWPTPVVMAGLPYLLDTLYLPDPDPEIKKLRGEAARRFDFIRIPDATINTDGPLIEKVIEKYCTMLGVKSLLKPSDEIGGRLLHAARYAFGHGLVIAQHAVALAHCRDGKKGKLQLSDFAATTRIMGGGAMAANIFAVSRWSEINPDVLMPESFAEARYKEKPDAA
ncbi:ATP-binding protein [Devosia sp. 1635]|uniref:ATP-binding protein n=1 Tax=Devosia sp. 1635 TaxID=2726066 RepID=UPI001563F50E|nr:ATP-binding protein [Devosia sp. 1635]